MATMRLEQQRHGYLNGHQRLAASLVLEPRDQDVIDRLSDLSGSLGPGETCPPYLSGYAVPSRSHYVLGRTWYDHSAPRAGCVLTHSLLIPMEEWATSTAPEVFGRCFEPFEREAVRSRLLPVELGSHAPVEEERGAAPEGAEELVEALFLEARQPIVWFNQGISEGTLFRLVRVLWPGLRNTFAFCTFSVQPRSVEGRQFDLLIAPLRSRSRFASWEGRRIDTTAPHPTGRHPWTKRIVGSLFEEWPPSLGINDELGLLAKGGHNDGSHLRLSILWNDLKEKSGDNPTAFLGMLDVLASARGATVGDSALAEPLVAAAAQAAVRMLPPDECLRYLWLLVGKLPTVNVSFKLRRAIMVAASHCVAEAPAAVAIAVIQPAQRVAEWAVAAVIRGAARGLAGHVREGQADAVLGQLPDESMLRLIALSPHLAASTMSVPTSEGAPWWIELARTASAAADDTKACLHRSLLPRMRRAEHAPILRALLASAKPEQVGDALRVVLRPTVALDVPELVAVAASVLLPDHGSVVIDRVLDLPETSLSCDGLLVQASTERGGLRQLLNDRRFSATRAERVLPRLLAALDDRQLREHLKDSAIAEKAVSLLMPRCADPETARNLVRVLLEAQLPLEVLVDSTLAVAGDLSDAELSGVLAVIVRRLIAAVPVSKLPLRAIDLLRLPAATTAVRRVGSRQILEWLIPYGGGSRTDSLSPETLGIAAIPAIEALLPGEAEELSRRLAAGVLTPGEMRLWLRTLRSGLALGDTTALAAAAIAVNYVFRQRPREAEALLQVAFPAVYEAVSSSRHSYAIDQLFSFFDWDRAKTLRQELVASFAESDWHPGDLLMIAEACGIGKKILKRVSRRPEGRELLRAMKVDLRGRPESEAGRALDRLVEFEAAPPSPYEWD